MPRKLGPRHARSRRALATVNRLASAANDIWRLAWHDHQSVDGEQGTPSAFVLGDRKAAQHLAALWLFARRLAAGPVTRPLVVQAARRDVEALHALKLPRFTESDYKTLKQALANLGKLPRAEVARAISHILASAARLRCAQNVNRAYTRKTPWSSGALWNPPVTAMSREQRRLEEEYGSRLPKKAKAGKVAKKAAAGKKRTRPAAPAAPPPSELPVKVPEAAEEVPDPETAMGAFDGLRGLGGSIFARRAGGSR